MQVNSPSASVLNKNPAVKTNNVPMKTTVTLGLIGLPNIATRIKSNTGIPTSSKTINPNHDVADFHSSKFQLTFSKSDCISWIFIVSQSP